MLVDEAEDNDWALTFQVDLDSSRVAGQPVMRLVGFGEYRS